MSLYLLELARPCEERGMPAAGHWWYSLSWWAPSFRHTCHKQRTCMWNMRNKQYIDLFIEILTKVSHTRVGDEAVSVWKVSTCCGLVSILACVSVPSFTNNPRAAQPMITVLRLKRSTV